MHLFHLPSCYLKHSCLRTYFVGWRVKLSTRLLTFVTKSRDRFTGGGGAGCVDGGYAA